MKTKKIKLLINLFYIILFAGSILFVQSCTQQTNVKELEYDSVTQAWLDKNGKPFSGVLFRTYENSNIIRMKMDCTNGKMDGFTTFYYKTGQIAVKIKVPLTRGVMPVCYNPDGQEISFEEFHDKGYNKAVGFPFSP